MFCLFFLLTSLSFPFHLFGFKTTFLFNKCFLFTPFVARALFKTLRGLAESILWMKAIVDSAQRWIKGGFKPPNALICWVLYKTFTTRKRSLQQQIYSKARHGNNETHNVTHPKLLWAWSKLCLSNWITCSYQPAKAIIYLNNSLHDCPSHFFPSFWSKLA